MGFKNIEVNSNGIKMAESVEYCKTLKKALVPTQYISSSMA